MDAERLLHRIFSLARRPARAAEIEMPFGMETTVLAHWREATAERSGSQGLLRGLRWAALLAGMIALLVGALERDQLRVLQTRYEPAERVADSAIVAGYNYE